MTSSSTAPWLRLPGGYLAEEEGKQPVPQRRLEQGNQLQFRAIKALAGSRMVAGPTQRSHRDKQQQRTQMGPRHPMEAPRSELLASMAVRRRGARVTMTRMTAAAHGASSRTR